MQLKYCTTKEMFETGKNLILILTLKLKIEDKIFSFKKCCNLLVGGETGALGLRGRRRGLPCCCCCCCCWRLCVSSVRCERRSNSCERRGSGAGGGGDVRGGDGGSSDPGPSSSSSSAGTSRRWRGWGCGASRCCPPKHLQTISKNYVDIEQWKIALIWIFFK